MHVKDTDTVGASARPTSTPAPRGRPRPGRGRPASGSLGWRQRLTRVTVNLNRQAVQALEAVSDSTGYSETDTINHALQVSPSVQRIIEHNGILTSARRRRARSTSTSCGPSHGTHFRRNVPPLAPRSRAPAHESDQPITCSSPGSTSRAATAATFVDHRTLS